MKVESLLNFVLNFANQINIDIRTLFQRTFPILLHFNVDLTVDFQIIVSTLNQ